MDYLVLGDMGDNHTNLKLGKILLEFYSAVDRQENIKLILSDL